MFRVQGCWHPDPSLVRGISGVEGLVSEGLQTYGSRGYRGLGIRGLGFRV